MLYFCRQLESKQLYIPSKLEDAPWPATKDELIDYAMRSGAPLEVIENLQEMEDEGEIYESIEDIWPDYPSKEDFFFNELEISDKKDGRGKYGVCYPFFIAYSCERLVKNIRSVLGY